VLVSRCFGERSGFLTKLPGGCFGFLSTLLGDCFEFPGDRSAFLTHCPDGCFAFLMQNPGRSYSALIVQTGADPSLPTGLPRRLANGLQTVTKSFRLMQLHSG
jgi:hypothetical protein